MLRRTDGGLSFANGVRKGRERIAFSASVLKRQGLFLIRKQEEGKQDLHLREVLAIYFGEINYI